MVGEQKGPDPDELDTLNDNDTGITKSLFLFPFPFSFSLPTLYHDDVIALAGLGLGPFRVASRAGLQFKCDLFKLGQQAASGFPP